MLTSLKKSWARFLCAALPFGILPTFAEPAFAQGRFEYSDSQHLCESMTRDSMTLQLLSLNPHAAWNSQEIAEAREWIRSALGRARLSKADAAAAATIVRGCAVDLLLKGQDAFLLTAESSRSGPVGSGSSFSDLNAELTAFLKPTLKTYFDTNGVRHTDTTRRHLPDDLIFGRGEGRRSIDSTIDAMATVAWLFMIPNGKNVYGTLVGDKIKSAPADVLNEARSSAGPPTPAVGETRYKASVTTLMIAPMPIPGNVKPYILRACFDVDTIGRARLLEWTKSGNAAYDRKLEQTLNGFRFRPAMLPNGTAVRDTVCQSMTVQR